MRPFNELVFDRIVRGNLNVFSTAQWNDLLGCGDDLVYEVEVVAGPLAGTGQVGVKLSDPNGWARVRIWVCGRTK